MPKRLSWLDAPRVRHSNVYKISYNMLCEAIVLSDRDCTVLDGKSEPSSALSSPCYFTKLIVTCFFANAIVSGTKKMHRGNNVIVFFHFLISFIRFHSLS